MAVATTRLLQRHPHGIRSAHGLGGRLPKERVSLNIQWGAQPPYPPDAARVDATLPPPSTCGVITGSCQDRKIDLTCWNSRNPSGPSSRPMPEFFIPPYGAVMSGR